ncbi:MAG: hypothetical protein PHR21_08525 [Oscillospiraceae bacterium]|nr:hypothetical protein [Oscillospiraceae bacterium]MDD4367648.1 hypothetical protein [Oscillospiraceae bacterium]
MSAHAQIWPEGQMQEAGNRDQHADSRYHFGQTAGARDLARSDSLLYAMPE